MIFTIGTRNILQYPHSHDLGTNGLTLYTQYPLSNWQFGYRLNRYGGNFVKFEIDQLCVRLTLSFWKDFDLWQDATAGVLISNDTRMSGTPLPNDLVSVEIQPSHMCFEYFPWREYLMPESQSVAPILAHIVNALTANLQTCLTHSQNNKIVFTGGLDSSLLAFIALHRHWSFTAVINQTHREQWAQLPFAQIDYARSTQRSDPWGESSHIKESYYDSGYDNCITAFFGDCVMLHNSTLFHQCRQLHDEVVELYDRTADPTAVILPSDLHVLAAIKNTMTNTRFRQWFADFTILDPYRDPDLLRLIMQLDKPQRFRQFGSAWVQRQLITSMDPAWAQLLCKNKNVYDHAAI